MSTGKVSFLDTTNASDEELRLIEEYVQPGKTPPPQIKLPFEVKDAPTEKTADEIVNKREIVNEKAEPSAPPMSIMPEAQPEQGVQQPPPHPSQHGYFPYHIHPQMMPSMMPHGQYPPFPAYPPNMYFNMAQRPDGSQAPNEPGPHMKHQRHKYSPGGQKLNNSGMPFHHIPVSGQSPFPIDSSMMRPQHDPSMNMDPSAPHMQQAPHPYAYSFPFPYPPNMMQGPPGQPQYMHPGQYPIVHYPGFFHMQPVSSNAPMNQMISTGATAQPVQAPPMIAGPLPPQSCPTGPLPIGSVVGDQPVIASQPIEQPPLGPSPRSLKPGDGVTDSQKLENDVINQPSPSGGDNIVQSLPPQQIPSDIPLSTSLNQTVNDITFGDFDAHPQIPDQGLVFSSESINTRSSPSSVQFISESPSVSSNVQVPPTTIHPQPSSNALPARERRQRSSRNNNKNAHNSAQQHQAPPSSSTESYPSAEGVSPKTTSLANHQYSQSSPNATESSSLSVASLSISETESRKEEDQVPAPVVSMPAPVAPSQQPGPQAPKPVTNKPWASLFKAPGSSSDPAPYPPSTVEPPKFDPTPFIKASTSKSAVKVVRTFGSNNVEVVTPADDSLARRLGTKIRKIPLRHSLPYIIPRGFVNRGNWCYVNATLQALITCPPLYNLLREIGEIPDVVGRHPTCTPVLDAMSNLLHSAFLPTESFGNRKQNKGHQHQEELVSGDPIEPKCIYEVLELINKETVKGRQEDAEEFLSSLLNKMHEEIVELFKYIDGCNEERMKANGGVNGHQDDGEEAEDDSNLWNEVRSKHKSVPTRIHTIEPSPIRQIFGGENVTIRGGQSGFGDRQPFFVLPLDIQLDRVKAIEDSLRLMAVKQQIHGFTDPKTGKSVESQTLIDKLPQILILQLKVFNFDPKDGSAKKLIKRVDFPIELEIPRDILYEEKRGKDNKLTRTYKLLTVMYHDGKEAFKGHYLTDNFHIGSQQWIRCDDATIKPTAGNKLTRPEPPLAPYLLFYRRCDTLRAQQSDRDRDNRDSHRGGSSSKSSKESNRDSHHNQHHGRGHQSSNIESHNRFIYHRSH